MNHLIMFSIHRPWRVVMLALICIALFLPGVAMVEFRTDGQHLVPGGSPEVQRDRAIRAEFSLHDLVIVLIEPVEAPPMAGRSAGGAGVFEPDVLAVIDALTERLASIVDEAGGASWAVRSLATEPSHRVRPGTLDFRPWLDPLPEDQHGAQRLRSEIETVGIYRGLLYAFDGRSASILVPVPTRGVWEPEDVIAARAWLYEEILAAADEVGEGYEILLTGAPVAEHQLGLHLLEDLGLPRVLLGAEAMKRRPVLMPDAATLDRLRKWIGEHVGLLPLVIVLIFGIFLLVFRSLIGAILPLTEVLAAFIVVFGLMGYLGVPIYLTTVVMPIILAAIGVADEVHIFDRYRHLMRQAAAGGGLSALGQAKPMMQHPRPSHHDVLFAAMGQMRRPIFRTSVTTSIGFLSFSLSPLPPVQSFGIFTAIGVIVCMIWSFTVVPAVIAMSDPKVLVRGMKEMSDADGEPSRHSGLIAMMTQRIMRWRLAVVAAAALVVVMCPFGIQRVEVQDSWLDGFSPHSRFAHASRSFNERFQGLHQLFILIDFGDASFEGKLPRESLQNRRLHVPAADIGDDLDVTGWRLIVEYESSPDVREVYRTEGVRHVATWVDSVTREDDILVLHLPRQQQSLHVLVHSSEAPSISYRLYPAAVHQREHLVRLNDLTDRVRSLEEYRVGGALSAWDYVQTTNLMATGLNESARVVPERRDRIDWLWQEFLRLQGAERVSQIVNQSRSRTIISVLMKDANYQDTAALLETLRAYEHEHLQPHGIEIDFAGDVAVSQAMIGSIVQTQRQSLLISLIGIFIAASLFGRSLWTGFLCVLPCGLAVLGIFAVMGWTGIPLGIATSMFAGMTLGIGIDFALHLVERFRQAREAGCEAAEAITEAMATTVPAIVMDAMALGIGFAALLLSQVPANARLGFLLLLSFAGCLLATVILLPALIRLWPPRFHSLEEDV